MELEQEFDHEALKISCKALAHSITIATLVAKVFGKEEICDVHTYLSNMAIESIRSVMEGKPKRALDAEDMVQTELDQLFAIAASIAAMREC